MKELNLSSVPVSTDEASAVMKYLVKVKMKGRWCADMLLET